MKTLLLYLSILISSITYATTYNITYFTSDDQNTIREAIVEVNNDNGQLNIIISIEDNLVLFNLMGSKGNVIRLNSDNQISGGYLYKHNGKLRGNIFLKKENLIVIIREK